MIEIKYIGTDEFSDEDLSSIKNNNLLKGITNYKNEERSGSGLLIALSSDGLWRKYDLGHCSCYGPLENGHSGKFSKEEIIKLIEKEEVRNYANIETEEEKQNFIDYINNA